MSNSSKGRGCIFLFLLVFGIVGLFCLGVSLKHFYLQIRSLSWKPVTATIIDKEFIMHKYKNSKTYKTTCTYSYVYNNKIYTNDIISIGYGLDNIEKHHELNRLLTYVTKVTAYVNPNNPYDAVLAKGSNSSTPFLFVFGLLWCGIPFMFYIANKKFTIIFIISFVGTTALLFSGILYTDLSKKIEILEKLSDEEIKKDSIEDNEQD